jgi:hypothetical protein
VLQECCRSTAFRLFYCGAALRIMNRLKPVLLHDRLKPVLLRRRLKPELQRSLDFCEHYRRRVCRLIFNGESSS